MNKEYIYLNGKAIIVDDDNNKKVTDYYDNLNEILEQENLLETIENELKQHQSDLTETDQKINHAVWLINFFKIVAILFSIIIMIFCLNSSPVSNELFMNIKIYLNEPSKLLPLLKMAGPLVGGYIGLLTLVPGTLVYAMLQMCKKDKLKLETKISFLEQKKSIEIEKLNELKSLSKEIKEECKYYVGKVDNSKEINLQKKLELYNYLMTSKELLQKYLEFRELPAEFKNVEFSEEDIEIIRQSDKGYALSLKKKN